MFPLQNKHALRANWLELVTLCPSSHQTRRCLELPGSVDTCACFKVGSAHRVPTKLRNSKCLLQFYKDFLIAFSSLLPSLSPIISSFPFFPPASSSSFILSVPSSHSAQLYPEPMLVNSCPQNLPRPWPSCHRPQPRPAPHPEEGRVLLKGENLALAPQPL